ncbi:hypothetical protein P691DRAFT_781111 [Macrolepiota fuliginosa MF-IS2]|uniref:Uncharacterized protein n=1 Tax=Macrolepiota fuliginosa MF-IS2 TaxID=1400762 RepID=A0A9P5X033_9AGAR|nr:hypothetical protein P691DRAFT_781111 [Macrolepiota fuliginosa MF-IS2]
MLKAKPDIILGICITAGYNTNIQLPSNPAAEHPHPTLVLVWFTAVSYLSGAIYGEWQGMGMRQGDIGVEPWDEYQGVISCMVTVDESVVVLYLGRVDESQQGTQACMHEVTLIEAMMEPVYWSQERESRQGCYGYKVHVKLFAWKDYSVIVDKTKDKKIEGDEGPDENVHGQVKRESQQPPIMLRGIPAAAHHVEGIPSIVHHVQ